MKRIGRRRSGVRHELYPMCVCVTKNIHAICTLGPPIARPVDCETTGTNRCHLR